MTAEPDPAAPEGCRGAEALGRAYGIDIVVHDTFARDGQSVNATPNGYYDPGTGEIHLTLDAQQHALAPVLTHELTHFIKQWSAEKYTALEGFLRAELNRYDAGKFDALAEEKMRAAAGQGVLLDPD